MTAAAHRPGRSGTSGDTPFDPGAAAGRATDAILRDTLHGTARGTVVDSPPGAGKSTLVVRAALELAEAGRPLMVIAQTNAQVDDLVLRLAEKNPELPVGRLHSSDPDPYDKALDDLVNVRKSTKAGDLAPLPVVISTAAKWAHVKDIDPWQHAIVDEAYQMRSDALLAVAGLFERALFVGDPGQLDPFAIVGAEQWAGLSYDPSASAVTTLLAHNPELPQHRLPVSWRLPASAAPLVSGAFYPYTPFRSGTDHGDRSLGFTVASDGSGPDRVIDEAAESGWGLLELPAGHTPRTDPEAVRALAQVVRRLLDRGGVTLSERGPDPSPSRRTASRSARRIATRRRRCARRSRTSASRRSPWTRRTGCRAASSTSRSSCTLSRAAPTRRRSTWRRAACASWPPATATRASWSAARASPTCWTTTRRRNRSNWE